MKKSAITALLLVVALIGLSSAARADLEGFLSSLNVQARADLPGFSLKVSAQFGVPAARVESVLKSVDAPADAFMVFQLGQMAHREPDTVLQTYKAGKGKGWGVLAKELGIKPGSPEFHALKRGDLALSGQPAGGEDEGHGKGKGKGHGKKR